MTISERVVGDVTILDVTGDLTIGDGAVLLRDRCAACSNEASDTSLSISPTSPTWIAWGLGELVQTYVTPASQGGSLKLLHLTARLRDLLVITKLATVFDCFEDDRVR
jgi:anti-sigma B factor antagonist